MGRQSAPRPFLARLRRRSAARASALTRVAGPAVTAVAALGLAAASPGVQAQAPVAQGGSSA